MLSLPFWNQGGLHQFAHAFLLDFLQTAAGKDGPIGPLGTAHDARTPVHGQPKIIVQPARIVFLNDKDVLATSPPHPPDWFARFREKLFCELVVSGSCLATLRSLELRASRAKLALPFARTT
jgi:hypothetical protein